MERKNAWLSYGESDEKEMEKLTKDYRAFLDAGKTERECVTELVREAEANGYVSLEAKQAAGEKIQPGDKVYAVGMKKIMALFHVGHHCALCQSQKHCAKQKAAQQYKKKFEYV